MVTNDDVYVVYVSSNLRAYRPFYVTSDTLEGIWPKIKEFLDKNKTDETEKFALDLVEFLGVGIK